MNYEKILKLTEEKLTKIEIQILDLLRNEGQKTNKEIADILGKDQGNISKKMKSLLEKGRVTVRKYHEGTKNFKEYSLIHSRFLSNSEEIQKIYHILEKFIKKLSILTSEENEKLANELFHHYHSGKTILSIQHKNNNFWIVFLTWKLNDC